MTEENEKKSTDEWLNEHDSIQFELLKIKDEIVKDALEISDPTDIIDKQKNENDPQKNMDKESEMDHLRRIMESSPPPKPPFSQEQEEEKKPIERDHQIPMAPEKIGKTGPKLPEGKLPTSPDLTNKIASVLQLENKLKRRKFEMEKGDKDYEDPKTILRSKPPIKKPREIPVLEEIQPQEEVTEEEEKEVVIPSTKDPIICGPVDEIPSGKEERSSKVESQPTVDEGPKIEKKEGTFKRIFKRRVFLKKK